MSDQDDLPEDEQWYDEHVAPELWRLCLACKERGIPFLAYVAFDERRELGGRTAFFPPDPVAAVRLIDGAMKAKGNLDALCYGLASYTRSSGAPHSSSILMKLGVDPEPGRRT